MNTKKFSLRHIGPRPAEQQQMLNFIGVNSIDELIKQTIPDNIRLKKELDLDAPMSEQEFTVHMHRLSKQNKD